MIDHFLKFLHGSTQRKFTGKTVLVVDDNPTDRTLIRNILMKQGYKIVQAVNGQEGLEIARRDRPDLILLDCEMPIMDGNAMCRLLKNDEELNKIPVIFLTGLNTPQNIIDCFDADCENYLAKPVNSKILSTQIETALEGYSST
jgi:CheY-like chemotaxis protein